MREKYSEREPTSGICTDSTAGDLLRDGQSDGKANQTGLTHRGLAAGGDSVLSKKDHPPAPRHSLALLSLAENHPADTAAAPARSLLPQGSFSMRVEALVGARLPSTFHQEQTHSHTYCVLSHSPPESLSGWVTSFSSFCYPRPRLCGAGSGSTVSAVCCGWQLCVGSTAEAVAFQRRWPKQ